MSDERPIPPVDSELRGGPHTSRRSLLAAVGGGAALLAGCGASDSSDDASPTETATGTASNTPTSTDPVETATPSPTAAVGAAREPTLDLRMNWNAMGSWNLTPYQAIPGVHNHAIYPTLTPFGANAGHHERAYEPLLMAANELVDNAVWRHTVAEGFSWHDGDPVTAEDRFYKAKYHNTLQTKLDRNPAFESVELVGDGTVEQTLRRPQNPIRFHARRRPAITHKAGVYEPHLESLTDATSGGEAFQVHEQLKGGSIPPEEWVGHGMFEVADANEERLLLERYEDYPGDLQRAQNIERVRIPIRQDENTKNENVGSETTDWFVSVHNVDGIPDSYTQVKRRTSRQASYRFNHTNEHISRLGVRRAIAYVQAWTLIVDGHASHRPEPILDGLTPLLRETWLPDSSNRWDEYIAYGGYSEDERATAALQAEGYERNTDDKWVGPDGDLLEITIADIQGSDLNFLDDWLENFGFTVEYQMVGGYDDTWASYDEDWDLVASRHGGGANHPAVSYENDVRWGVELSTQDGGETVPVGNRALEYELPTELGATDLSGETETINVPELQAQVSDPAVTAEDLVEPTKKLSWWWNYYQPDLINYNFTDYYIADYDNYVWGDWNGDGVGDAFTPYEVSYGLHTGQIRSTEK